MGQSISDLKEAIAADLGSPATPPNEDGILPSLVVSVAKPFEEWKGYVKDLPAIMDAFLNSIHGGPGQDDRLLLLEKLITWMANHPDSRLSKKFEALAIDLLYKDLPRPPQGYLRSPRPLLKREREDVNYIFRAADGSNYNFLLPHLGQAGMPYARTVPSAHPFPPALLPDAGLVFDVLLKRDKYTPHPAGVSSLFFAFADLVIHSLFNTSREDATINNSSSYLDLSPLYGSSLEQQDSIRCKDGAGKLHADTFADSRLLFMPPSVCALLVLLSRNHNYIADRILNLNEKGHLKDPNELHYEARLAQDEEIFQRARLVNCGFFMQIILADYVGAILGLVREGKDWRLNVLEPIRRFDHTLSPRGDGNAVSIEFNLMYRWHATLSEPDAEWITKEFQALFPGKELSTLTHTDLKAGYRRASPAKDTREWTFGGLKRGSNGRFSDAELANILHDATETYASAFKARGIPEALKVVEILGIEQARSWGTCSLNEFRKFMGLKPYSRFSDWNPDPEIHQAAEALYHDVDNLELYVGLQAEESKKPTPGAGLCPGYTISRAILADAICLTRGDPFMTINFTPEEFTAWGYRDCQVPKNDGSYGGMLTKLLLRTLPEYYPVGSAYTHFPFMVPDAMKEVMQKRADPAVNDYTWSRPSTQPVIFSYPGNDSPELESIYQDRIKSLTHHLFERQTIEELVAAEASLGWFASATTDCINSRSFCAAGSTVKYIDIAKDVIKVVPVQWVANLIGIPLDCTFDDLADYIYVNVIPEQRCILRNKSRDITATVLAKVDEAIRGLSDVMAGGYGAQSPVGDNTVRHDTPFVLSLRAKSRSTGRTPEDLAADFLGAIVATVPLFSRALLRVLDHIVSDGELAREMLSQPSSAESDTQLATYITAVVEAVDDIGVRVGLMNDKFITTAGLSMLRAIFARKDLTRAPGRPGRLRSVAIDRIPAEYADPRGELCPWPPALLLQYSSGT